jgi:DNA-binding SARP family transcriptional activator
VTLAHLLDVIDPERVRARGSSLVVESAGGLHFERQSGLRIDLWDLERLATDILGTPGYERPSLLAQGRRLLRIDPGPPLGGAAIGEWFEPHRRRFGELVTAAALHAGGVALAAGDQALGEDLGQRALSVDPWSEQAHRLVVEARLAAGNLDGARRGLRHTREMLDELGIAPAPATHDLMRRAGLGPGYAPPPPASPAHAIA